MIFLPSLSRGKVANGLEQMEFLKNNWLVLMMRLTSAEKLVGRL